MRNEASYKSRSSVIALTAVAVLALVSACSTPETATKKSNPALAAQGGTTNVDAIAEFNKAVEVYEKSDGKNLGAVVSALEEAVDEDPNFGKAWFNLGLIYERQGDAAEAREAYTKAAETAKDLGAPLVNLGMLAIDSGDESGARRYFERALEAEAFNPAAHNNISVFYRKEEDWQSAVRHARLSLAGDSQNVNAYTNLARIYYERGNHDVAKLVILNALKLENIDPQPDLHNMLGLVELARNEVNLAIHEFEEAIKLDPKHLPARANLGAILLNVRDYTKAVEHFEIVLAGQPNNIEAKMSVAVAKRGMGDLKAAEAIYAEIREKDPQNPLLQFNLAVLEHEHKAHLAITGDGKEAPSDPVGQMNWSIENMKSAITHYEKALEHYRNFLAWDKSGNEHWRKDADERIGQVAELIETTREQIPVLEQQREELKEALEAQAAYEAEMAAQQKAEQEAAAAEKAGEGDQPADAEQPAEAEQPEQ